MTAEARPLTPEARAREGAAGSTVTIEGADWRLAHAPTAQSMDKLRDSLYEGIITRGEVTLRDVRTAAMTLIRANYDVSWPEALRLAFAADADALTGAVVDSLIGRNPTHTERTYSHWVRSSLLANGLDPARIPAEAISDVLAQLVETGRAVEHTRFVSVAIHQQARARVLAQADWD